jgi:hypothetical protein
VAGNPLLPTLQDGSYNWVYRQLVTDPNDAVGAFAYVLYKQEKIAFIEAIKQTRGREPTVDEMRTFHVQTSTQPRVESYIKSAEQLASDFLNAGLKKHLQDFEEDIRESVLSQKVDAVTAELQTKRGTGQWFADIASNLIVSLATILVVGLLLGGYQAMSKFNTYVEQILKMPPSEVAPAPVPSTAERRMSPKSN